jgi:uncharacterized protein (TIGR00369 family)
MAERPGAPFTEYIGALMNAETEGHVRLTLATGPQHAGSDGLVHPGVLASVMDSVIGIALGRLRGEEHRKHHGPHATIALSTSFYAPASPGEELVFEGRVVRVGEGVAFGEVETRSANGQTLASAHLTFAIPRHSHPEAPAA